MLKLRDLQVCMFYASEYVFKVEYFLIVHCWNSHLLLACQQFWVKPRPFHCV